MYQVGDWIFYGNIGACQVKEIGRKKIPGVEKEHLYYTLQPLNSDCSISTPADSEKVFMRPVISKDEAEHLIGMIPTMTPKAYYNAALRQLTEHYESLLNSHDCQELIQMTMSIYEKKKEVTMQKRKLGAVDEKFMRKAEELLFGELSIALGIEKNQVQDYIVNQIGPAHGEGKKEA